MYTISAFTIFQPTTNAVLAKNLYTGAIVLFTNEARHELDAWLSEQDTREAPDSVNDLIEQGILVPAQENEYVAWRTNMLATRNNEAHIFTMHFEPTLQCQLECPYCLELGVDRGHSMESLVLEQSLTWFKQYCEANPSVDMLRFKLFGGEPLLCKRLIRQAVSAYHELCNALSVEFVLEMTTNGVLLDEQIARFLSEHCWRRVQITFDGPADIHDTRRVGKGGRPTFEQIFANVRMLLDGNHIHAVDVRMTLDSGTASHLPRLLDALAHIPGSQSRINLSLGVTTATFTAPNERMRDDLLADAALATWAHAQKLGFEIPDEFVAGPVCVATARHSAVLQPDGSLQKCFCTSGRHEFDFGHVSIPVRGYTQDARFEQWTRTDPCIVERCAYLPICGGGCVYEAMVEHGAAEGPADRICRKDLLDRMNRGLLNLCYG